VDVTVCIGTYGAQEWAKLAQDRAIPSAKAQGVPVVHVHAPTLARARNEAMNMAETEFVIHLDADDELGEGYVEAMATGSADLRAPALQRVRHGKLHGEPYVPRVWGHEHDCVAECLRAGNWLLVGTCLRAELACEVGGWEEFEWSEDWALFARCWKAGGTVEAIPSAIYRGHMSPGGRNRRGRHAALRYHRQIERAVWPEDFEEER
jgi:hypothetical protein